MNKDYNLWEIEKLEDYLFRDVLSILSENSATQ